MGKNLASIKLNATSGIWISPAGVTEVRAKVIGYLYNQLGCGNFNSVMIDAFGDAYSSGQNGSGELGTGNVANTIVPTLVAGGMKWRQIGVGVYGSTGINQNGDAYSWGANPSGEIGDGTQSNSLVKSTPTLVVGGYKWREVNRGYDTDLGNFTSVFGIRNDGAGMAWGHNSCGQLGDGTLTSRSSPTLILGGQTWKRIVGGNSFVYGFSAGITLAGDAYCWGDNSYGQIGNGTSANRYSSPTLVSGGLKFKRIAAGSSQVAAITNAGDMYAWGFGGSGELGNGGGGYLYARSTPQLVQGGRKWLEVACGNNTTWGIDVNNDLYSWGDNTLGQGGRGTSGSGTQVSVPTLVIGSKKWASINSGFAPWAIGITTQGDIYCLGDNTLGQFGNSTAGNAASSPTLMSGAAPKIWRAVNEMVLAQRVLTITPSTAYNVTILGNAVLLGNYTLHMNSAAAQGYVPDRIVLEYQG